MQLGVTSWINYRKWCLKRKSSIIFNPMLLVLTYWLDDSRQTKYCMAYRTEKSEAISLCGKQEKTIVWRVYIAYLKPNLTWY